MIGKFPPVLVGREKEIAVLKKAMEDCKAGRGCTILINGDIGTGKTRLADEFSEICEKEGFVVLSSICFGNSQPPYLPITTALRNYTKKVRGNQEMHVPLGLAGFQIFEAWTSHPEEVIKERTRMLEYLLHQFISISKQRPVLFVIDDLHLADSATLAFFHYLARNIGNERIVGLATFVGENGTTDTIFAKTLRNMNIERECISIKLENLIEGDVCLLVNECGFEKPDEIGRYIYERTSGNPLFVTEFLMTAQNAGLRVEEIKKMRVPENLRELLRFRVSKLDENKKKVLMNCAVLGMRFEYDVLAEVVGIEEDALLDALDVLISQDFLAEVEDTEEGYKFVSRVLQEVIYEEITSVRKRLMHQKAAEVLERKHGEKEEFWSSLAYHYKRSGIRNKFLEYAMKAGRNAARKFANEEAIDFLKEALRTLKDTADELPHKIDVCWELAEALEMEGRYDEAVEILEERITYTSHEKLPEEVGKSHRKKAEIYIYKGDYENAFLEIEKAAQWLRSLEGTDLELARVWSWRGIVYERKGDYRTAIECQEKALHVFEKRNATKDYVGALNRIGVCLWYLGEYEKALEIYQKCIEIQEKLGDLRGICTLYNNMGLVYDDKGDYEQALEYHKKSLVLKEKIGDVWGIAASYNNIGLIYDDMGEYESALEFYEKCLEIYKKIGDVWGIAVSYGNIGVIHFNRGDYEKALEDYEKSLEIYQRIGDMLGVAEIYTDMGLVFENKEDYEKALKYFQESIELATQIKNKELISEGFLHMSAVYIAKSDMKLAKECLKEGKRIATEIGIRQLIAYAKVVEGKLLVAKGKLEMGIKMLKDALEIYDEIKSRGVEYYTVLFEIGRIEQNKEILENVLEFFERTGNKVWMAKVKRELLP
ncbi:MAG: DUF2791 family P-loop domain-containing protein [Thermoplasmata archaeon]